MQFHSHTLELRILRIDRRAYLHWIRNIRRGLSTRTEIIEQLDDTQWKAVSEIAKNLKVTPETVRYHLYNMYREKLVEREPEGSGWRLGELDQAQLSDYIKPKRKRKSRKK